MSKNNRFKRFMRRVNRGVVLGLIFGIILVGFVVADALNFKKDSAGIRDNIVSYIMDMTLLNAKLEQTAVGKTITDGDRDAMREGLDEIFAKYYAAPTLAEKITVYEGYDSDEIKRVLEDWFFRTSGFDLISARAKADDDVFRISFERQGYRFALVRINDLPLVLNITEARGNEADIFLGGGPSYLIDPKFPDELEIWGSAREKTIYVSGTLYITLQDGEWKILMSEFYTKQEPELD